MRSRPCRMSSSHPTSAGRPTTGTIALPRPLPTCCSHTWTDASSRGSNATDPRSRRAAYIITRSHMRIGRRFAVIGRVQGVGFRYFVHEAAVREAVTGYVRNLSDGSVEAYVEGEVEAVDRVERAIRMG